MSQAVKPGDRFVITGFGATALGSDIGIGTPRAATLIATGKPGNLQIRLFDPATHDIRAGLGACTGDSGGPAFVESQGAFAVNMKEGLYSRLDGFQAPEHRPGQLDRAYLFGL